MIKMNETFTEKKEEKKTEVPDRTLEILSRMTKDDLEILTTAADKILKSKIEKQKNNTEDFKQKCFDSCDFTKLHNRFINALKETKYIDKAFNMLGIKKLPMCYQAACNAIRDVKLRDLEDIQIFKINYCTYCHFNKKDITVTNSDKTCPVKKLFKKFEETPLDQTRRGIIATLSIFPFETHTRRTNKREYDRIYKYRKDLNGLCAICENSKNCDKARTDCEILTDSARQKKEEKEGNVYDKRYEF